MLETSYLYFILVQSRYSIVLIFAYLTSSMVMSRWIIYRAIVVRKWTDENKKFQDFTQLS